MTIAARDDRHAHRDHDRDRLTDSVRLSRQTGRATTRARAGIASADHRDAKIGPPAENRLPDPESATRGKMGRFESFSSPIRDPAHPSLLLLR
jgi:hypothetical protein